jgi:imidazolonepropionase-like amidohydrolase
MADILFKNMALLDTKAGELLSGRQVLVRDKTIAEVSEGAIDAPGAQVLDLGGRTLMPGVIDCHNHVVSKPVGNPYTLGSWDTARAAERLRRALMRGFTTMRDAGGADLGHKMAVEEGLFIGPRLFVSGHPISQTGGHGDKRSQADLSEPCMCVGLGPGTARVADGIDEVRHAARDEIRLGADQIKVHASGGVGSTVSSIDQLQYSMDELKALVDEATRSHTYILTHTYPAEAIKRCVEAGVRTIEHGNLIDEEAAAMMAKAGTYLVPTLTIYHETMEHGPERGFSPDKMQKCAYVMEAGSRSLEIAKRAGVKVAFGTDVGSCPDAQSREFQIRAEVQSAAEILHSATVVSAEVVRMEGKIGVIQPDAYADMLVVDGDPLEDLSLLAGQGEHLSAIMKEGTFYKNEL